MSSAIKLARAGLRPLVLRHGVRVFVRVVPREHQVVAEHFERQQERHDAGLIDVRAFVHERRIVLRRAHRSGGGCHFLS